ncbi:MAG: hypothetical protein FWG87_13400 [Defluviitaleaceae bacterium]|nr:hypothetical protein [Defluviitaleaceae bacterium]
MSDCFSHDKDTNNDHFPYFSGMTFVADNAYPFEKLTKGLNKNKKYKHVKSVEFIRGRGKKLFFIEAKTSFANPNNTKGKDNFRNEINEVFYKFLHSLNLYFAIKLGVVPETPPTVNGIGYTLHSLHSFNLEHYGSLNFVLVINSTPKGFKEDWCRNIQVALENKRTELNALFNIWNLMPTIRVMTDVQARKSNLVT